VGCQQPGEPRAEPLRWQVGLTGTWFDTQLFFEELQDVGLQQTGAALWGSRDLGEGWSLRASAGWIATGQLVRVEPDPSSDTVRSSIRGGWQLGAQAHKRWLTAQGGRPFLVSSLGLAVGHSQLEGDALVDRMLATDLRLGAALGWEVAGFWSPYLGAQVFGGPVFLVGERPEPQEDFRSLGSDTRHYRVSLGSSFFVGDRLSLFVDVAGLGELGLVAGAGWAF
jgi:hypothetical protein